MTGRRAAVCGIDIGTTAIKALLVDAQGQVLAQKGLPCPLHTGAGGVCEQDAGDWYTLAAQCVWACVREAEDADVLALSISAQAGCLIAVDARGTPLHRAISWMDERAAGYVARLPDETVYRHSGWRTRAGFNAAKLLWLSAHAPDIMESAAWFLSTVDYVHTRLCGLTAGLAIDPSNAALTQLYDIDSGDWSGDLLAAAGIDRARLPRIVPSGAPVGPLSMEAARDMGLRAGIPVVSGGHDQYCAAAGAGALAAGDLLVSMGTAWAVLAITERRMLDMQGFAASGSHVAPGKYGLMTTLTAGGALEWLRRTALPGVGLAALDAEAGSRRMQARGLLCLPHFSGMSYPHWQDNARASYVGLGLEHDAYDMALALMEGTAFDVRDKLSGYRALGFSPAGLRLAGGGAKSGLWTSIVQAVCDVPAVRCGVTEAASLGAAALAGVHMGVWPSLEAAAATFGEAVPCAAPPEADVAYYEEKYARYSRLLGHVKTYYQEEVSACT